MKLNDITLSKANAIWRKAATFDEKVYEIMQYITNSIIAEREEE